MTKPLIYLASPYSDPDPAVMARRAACVAAVTARLLKEGKQVFSPIAYSHQFAVERGVGTDWEAWKEFGVLMLGKCDEIWILDIPGVNKSKGVLEEISLADDHDMPDPELLQPTPEELAILDEPKEEGPMCKWYDAMADEEHACTQPGCVEWGHPECLSDTTGPMSGCGSFEKLEEPKSITQPEPKETQKDNHCRWHDALQSKAYACIHPLWIARGNKSCLHDGGIMPSGEPFCSKYEPKVSGEEPEPIKQPEPKCKFWSDEDGGVCRCHLKYRSENHDLDKLNQCKVTINCGFFLPAEEVIEQAIKDYRESNWKSAQELIDELEKPVDEEDPTAEEKIIEGLEGFADESESNTTKCPFWNAAVKQCRATDQSGAGDCEHGECPRTNPDKFPGWTEDSCKIYRDSKDPHPCAMMCWNGCQFSSREDCPAEECINFTPREIPPPEYNPDDVAFGAEDKIQALMLKASKTIDEHYDIMCDLIKALGEERKKQ